jgi:hypothetical protein
VVGPGRPHSVERWLRHCLSSGQQDGSPTTPGCRAARRDQCQCRWERLGGAARCLELGRMMVLRLLWDRPARETLRQESLELARGRVASLMKRSNDELQMLEEAKSENLSLSNVPVEMPDVPREARGWLAPIRCVGVDSGIPWRVRPRRRRILNRRGDSSRPHTGRTREERILGAVRWKVPE